MNKKFLLTTLLLGSLIALSTTGCFQKADDTSMTEETKMEQAAEEKAQPACQIEDEDQAQMQEEEVSEEGTLE